MHFVLQKIYREDVEKCGKTHPCKGISFTRILLFSDGQPPNSKVFNIMNRVLNIFIVEKETGKNWKW